MEEFLVLMRHRLGWPDARHVLVPDLRPMAHERGGVLRHSHAEAEVDLSLKKVRKGDREREGGGNRFQESG